MTKQNWQQLLAALVALIILFIAWQVWQLVAPVFKSMAPVLGWTLLISGEVVIVALALSIIAGAYMLLKRHHIETQTRMIEARKLAPTDRGYIGGYVAGNPGREQILMPQVTYSVETPQHIHIQEQVPARTVDADMQPMDWREQIAREKLEFERQKWAQSLLDAPKDDMPALEEMHHQAPDALSLIEDNELPAGDDMLVGFDTQLNPVIRAWKVLKAILILGLQGGGKSTTALWLILQMIIKGARFGLIDKHAHSKDDSLWNRLKPLARVLEVPLGADPRSALRVVDHAEKVLRGRIATTLACDYPFVLVIDEFTRIMGDPAWAQVAEKLNAVLEMYNSEGRGHRCFAICIGQATNASRTGGTEVRDLFNTRLVHKMRAKQAQNLSLTEYQTEIAGLQTGEILVDIETDDPFLVCIPNVTEEAIQMLSDWLSAQKTMEHLVRTDELVDGAHRGAEGVRTGEINLNYAQATHRGAHLSQRLLSKAEKVLELKRFNPEMGKHTIVPEVWGISKGGSAQYKAACDEYEQILRSLVEQGELQG